LLIITGEMQSIVAGSGALLAATLVFGFLGWSFASGKSTLSHSKDGQPHKEGSPAQVVWLGIALTLLPGLLYFYLRYAMTRFDPNAVIFLSVPLLIAGLGCIGVGLWRTIRS